MPETLKIEINIPKLSDIAHTGVRRAVMFLGLGLNAAYKEDFLDYQLRKLPVRPQQTGVPIDFFPPDLPDNQILKFKEEFATWIMACGLREMLEHYALFLDKIHLHCLQVLSSKNHDFQYNPKKAHKKFVSHEGIPGKLHTLSRKFSIATGNVESINQLYIARNCLTHDLGIVKPSRCGQHGYLLVTWNSFDVFAVEEGSDVEIPIVDTIGELFENGISINTRACLREKRFNVGEKLVFTQQDLWELCYFFNAFAIPSMATSFLSFLRENGIQESLVE